MSEIEMRRILDQAIAEVRQQRQGFLQRAGKLLLPAAIGIAVGLGACGGGELYAAPMDALYGAPADAHVADVVVAPDATSPDGAVAPDAPGADASLLPDAGTLYAAPNDASDLPDLGGILYASP